tara:strand:- start:277 stop:459 length:183 start_codon:yes stop_codon:yes gene_type:complete
MLKMRKYKVKRIYSNEKVINEFQIKDSFNGNVIMNLLNEILLEKYSKMIISKNSNGILIE